MTRLLTLRDVAAALGVCERTVERMIDRGDLAVVPVAARGLRRVHPDDLDAYISAQRQRRRAPQAPRPRANVRPQPVAAGGDFRSQLKAVS